MNKAKKGNDIINIVIVQFDERTGKYHLGACDSWGDVENGTEYDLKDHEGVGKFVSEYADAWTKEYYND